MYIYYYMLITIGIDFNYQLLEVIFFESLAKGPQNCGDHISVDVAFLVTIEHIERFSQHFKDTTN